MRPGCTMKLPIVPGVGMYLSECKFSIWESKNQLDKTRFIQVVPRGIELTYSSVVADSDSDNESSSDIDGDSVGNAITNDPTTDGGGSISSSSSSSSSSVPSGVPSVPSGVPSVPSGVPSSIFEDDPRESKTEIKCKTTEKDPAVERINQWRRNIKRHIAKQMTLMGNDWVQELRDKSLQCASRMFRIRSLRNRDLSSAAMQSLSQCPAAYERVLRLLREADR